MYHELTRQDIKRRTRKRMLGLVAVVAVVALVWFASTAIGSYLRDQGELSVRNAILSSANQCYAIEGTYPATLDHLIDQYGLAIDRSGYIITYEVFADNVMPSVVVIAR